LVVTDLTDALASRIHPGKREPVLSTMGTREAIECLAERIEALEAMFDELVASVQALTDAQGRPTV
jgi:hypothetical protein